MERLRVTHIRMTGPDTFTMIFSNEVYVCGMGIDPNDMALNLSISKHGKPIVYLPNATLIDCMQELARINLDVAVAVSHGT